MTCWSEKREQRWDIRAVYNQFSTSSIREITDDEPGIRRSSSNVNVKLRVYPPFLDAEITEDPNTIVVAPPMALSLAPLSMKLEGDHSLSPKIVPHSSHIPTEPDPPAQQGPRRKQSKLAKKQRSQTAPSPSTPKRKVPKKHFTFPAMPLTGGVRESKEPEEPQPEPAPQRKRTRKIATLSRGWRQLRGAVKAMGAFLRLRKSPRTDGLPSK